MNWFKKKFGGGSGEDRTPPTSTEWPKLNEDWAPGDQALCLVTFLITPPVKDEVYIVERVYQGRTFDGEKAWGLVLRGIRPPAVGHFHACGYRAQYFRKITPKADTEECEESFKQLITRKTPVETT